MTGILAIMAFISAQVGRGRNGGGDGDGDGDAESDSELREVGLSSR